MDLSLKNSKPWLVLAGSGGLADFLTDLLENVSSAPVLQSSSEGDGEPGPSVDLKEKVSERVKKHFPMESDTDKHIERVSSVRFLSLVSRMGVIKMDHSHSSILCYDINAQKI